MGGVSRIRWNYVDVLLRPSTRLTRSYCDLRCNVQREQEDEFAEEAAQRAEQARQLDKIRRQQRITEEKEQADNHHEDANAVPESNSPMPVGAKLH